MSLCDRLPSVDKFCFCVNLKCGVFGVAVCGVLQLFCSVLQTINHRSRDCQSPFEDVIHWIGVGLVVIDTILCILSISLIVAIIRKIPKIVILFMCSVCLSILSMLVLAVVLLIAGFSSKECLILVSDSISTILLALIWVYFLIVVRSYYSRMVHIVVPENVPSVVPPMVLPVVPPVVPPKEPPI